MCDIGGKLEDTVSDDPAHFGSKYSDDPPLVADSISLPLIMC
jgi:hypothetical protein